MSSFPRQLVLALLLGLPMPLGFSPFEWWPLTLLQWAGLLWLIEGASPRRAMVLGLVFGLGGFSTGIYWISISLAQFGGAPWAFAVLCTALVVMLMAAYVAVFAGLLNRFAPVADWRRYAIMAPALWGLMEWLRSWLFSGFPWLAIGYSQVDGPLASLAPVMGVFGVSAVVMLVAGCLRMLRVSPWAAVAVLVASGAVALVLKPIEWSRVEGDALTVSVVQGNIGQMQKFRPELLQSTLRGYLGLSLTEAAGSDVIIWPETAIPAFYDDMRPFLGQLTEEARESGSDYLTGIAAGSWDTNVFHNAVVSIGSDEALYYKHRLLPFGEYLPMRGLFSVFRDFVDIPMADFTPGDADQPLLKPAGVPVGVSICFEAVFGSEIRHSMPQARYLVNVSNDAWFGRSLAPYQHLQIVRMRAIEMARPMARATNTGVSALVDHHGTVLMASELFETAVLKGEIQPRQGVTPYARFGDLPWVVLFALMLLAGWVRGCVRRPAPG